MGAKRYRGVLEMFEDVFKRAESDRRIRWTAGSSRSSIDR